MPACILPCMILLVSLHFLHSGAERQLVVASVVDGHSFCPELVDRCEILLIVQNVDFVNSASTSEQG